MSGEIVVVEDEPVFAEGLAEEMKRLLHRPARIFLTGTDFVNYLMKPHPPIFVVLLDLLLPDGHGSTIVPIIKRKTDAKIIVVSAVKGAKSKKDLYFRGADDYLEKPVDFELLAVVIKKRTGLLNVNYNINPNPKPPRLLRGGTGAGYASQNKADSKKEGADNKIVIAKNLIFEMDGNTLYDPSRDRRVGLSAREGELLKMLLSNRGRYVRYDEFVSYLDFVHDKRTLATWISRINKKLRKASRRKKWIVCNYNVGYLLKRLDPEK